MMVIKPLRLNSKPPKRKWVFLSYAHQDRRLVGIIQRALEAHGIGVWWDVDGIRCSDEFDLKIEEAIKDMACVVVFYSKAALESKWVRAETYCAVKQGKKILPVLLEPDVQLPLIVGTTHALSFHDPMAMWDNIGSFPQFKKLVQTLQELDAETAKGNTGNTDRPRLSFSGAFLSYRKWAISGAVSLLAGMALLLAIEGMRTEAFKNNIEGFVDTVSTISRLVIFSERNIQAVPGGGTPTPEEPMIISLAETNPRLEWDGPKIVDTRLILEKGNRCQLIESELYFKEGKTEYFDPKNVKDLIVERASTFMGVLKKSGYLLLVGLTDAKGEADTNGQLAKNRAIQVQRDFEINGISPGLVDILPQGEYGYPGDIKSEEPKQRRVDVYVCSESEKSTEIVSIDGNMREQYFDDAHRYSKNIKIALREQI